MTSSYVNGVTTTYAYRADGLRKSKTANGVITRHVWDGDQIVQDRTGWYTTTEYVRGIRLIDTFTYGDYARFTYIQNARGDVVGFVDGLTSIADTVDYDGFGTYESYTPTNPLGYCGEYRDAETGFIYLRARYYDPSIGRFTTEDPARDGLNWYVYCNNNPIAFVDPTGYITEEEIAMYENGEMAPMAYTYLMNLTYNWYLADDEASKAQYHQWAEEFRANNYLTTNGEFAHVDEGIAFMPTKPTGEITKEQHFFRNQLNLQFSWDDFQKLNSRLPENLQWKELPDEQSYFHKFGQPDNRKYVSACEHFEAVYTKENSLVNENFSPMNMGTYNYYGPTQAQKHTDIDVAPWLKWGNTPQGWIWSWMF